MNTATVNRALTYNQVLSLAMQLPDQERYTLCCDLSRGWRTAELRAIRKSIQACDLTDEEICQECEIVRQQMYDEYYGR